MKKLLILLFSFFLLSSPSVFADDISDFQIEGMSIGDSLLDYMTEDEILKEIELYNGYQWLKEPNKYAEIYLNEGSSTYENLSFFIRNNSLNQYVTDKNEKYIILSITGRIDYIEDFDSCIQKRDEILQVIPGMFPNTLKEEHNFNHSADPSGNSIIDGVYFYFDSGASIEATCYNFDETFRLKKKWSEGFNVAIRTKEIITWFNNK